MIPFKAIIAYHYWRGRLVFTGPYHAVCTQKNCKRDLKCFFISMLWEAYLPIFPRYVPVF